MRPDELHTAFNFDFLRAPWKAAALRATIDDTLAEHDAVGAPADLGAVQPRRRPARLPATAGRSPTAPAFAPTTCAAGRSTSPLGMRRARAAALLMLALPGGAYVYQGEELGLPEVEDLPEEVLQDPTWTAVRAHPARPRRLPGADAVVAADRRRTASAPTGAARAVAAAAAAVGGAHGRGAAGATGLDPDALPSGPCSCGTRPPALGDGGMRWLDSPEGALAFARDPGFACVVNVSAGAVPLPEGAQVLLASGPLDERRRGRPRHRRLAEHLDHLSRLTHSPAAAGPRPGATAPARSRGRRRAPGWVDGDPHPVAGPHAGVGGEPRGQPGVRSGRRIRAGRQHRGAVHRHRDVGDRAEPVDADGRTVEPHGVGAAAGSHAVGPQPQDDLAPRPSRAADRAPASRAAGCGPSTAKPASPSDSTSRAGSSPIAGLPTKPATNRSAGRSYSSRPVPVCTTGRRAGRRAGRPARGPRPGRG